MNIDWSNAPEGATHWDLGMVSRVAGWMKLDDGIWYWWPVKDAKCDMKWHASLNQHKIEIERFIARPCDWTGEGLPPVGVVCELRAHKLNEWGRAVIKFASRNVVVWDWEGEPEISGLCTRYAHEVEMRPIRTPEQIAEEEREAAIKDLYFTVNWSEGRETWPFISKNRKDDYAKAIDAGYCKQVQP